MQLPLEQFPALSAIGTCRHVFAQRIPGIDVSRDKAEVLKRLGAAHREISNAIDIGNWPLLTAQQIHGNKVAIIDAPVESDKHFAGCDGFITNQLRIALGVYVADCCAIYLVDPNTPAVGLVHSGRKGTELGVVTNAITQMVESFGSEPPEPNRPTQSLYSSAALRDDFAAEIVRQCRALRVKEIYDSGICTACDLDRYYSYRAEKGKTGRMLALLGLNPKL